MICINISFGLYKCYFCLKQEQRRTDIGVEEERQARERVKQEQDRAYQESLAADR